jgi:hypothetical protein
VLTRAATAVTGACLAVRKVIYEEVKGLDEANLAVDFNDIDFCLRLRERGLRIVWTPFSLLYHKESASRARHLNAEQARRFQAEVAYMRRRWGSLLDSDPYWNPNLSLNTQQYELAATPRANKPWTDLACLRPRGGSGDSDSPMSGFPA